MLPLFSREVHFCAALSPPNRIYSIASSWLACCLNPLTLSSAWLHGAGTELRDGQQLNSLLFTAEPLSFV